jgi:hypothetical protein
VTLKEAVLICNLFYHLTIWKERTEEDSECLSQNDKSPGKNFGLWPPECGAEMPTTSKRHLDLKLIIIILTNFGNWKSLQKKGSMNPLNKICHFRTNHSQGREYSVDQ